MVEYFFKDYFDFEAGFAGVAGVAGVDFLAAVFGFFTALGVVVVLVLFKASSSSFFAFQTLYSASVKTVPVMYKVITPSEDITVMFFEKKPGLAALNVAVISPLSPGL
jgi:hypothetical protein